MKITFIFLLFLPISNVNSQSYSANQIIDLIKENVNCEWREQTVDDIKAGSGDTKVTGIATTFMATMEVLEKAVEAKCNLIITHEPTFYNHFDDLEALKNDAVQKAKLEYIEENNLVIFRFHDHIHRMTPDGISEGVIERIGWQRFREGNGMLFNIPRTSLESLANEFASTFDSDIVRSVGDPETKVEKVKLILGAAGSETHFKALGNEDFDVLVVGEAREWETIPYVADARTMGMNKGLILLGHTDSEEAGMDYCADWLSTFVKSIPIKFIPSRNPMWGTKK